MRGRVWTQCFLGSVLAAGLAGCVSAPAQAGEVTVRDMTAFIAAVRAAKPGDRILVAPGEYQGILYAEKLQGAPGKPIVIAGADPAHPPQLDGSIALPDAAHVELRDLVIQNAKGNAINIHDDGTYATPAHHILMRNLVIRDMVGPGYPIGIKLAGVDDFQILNCTVEGGGETGLAVDLVGCHRGLTEGCTFRQGAHRWSVGFQGKGGSSQIVIRRNRFENAGARAINIGGSTGLQYFRPKPEGFEAKEFLVEGNVIVASDVPIAFATADGGIVRYNTFYRPAKWALRILQEMPTPQFVPCRNGVFQDNIIVFRSDSWLEGGVNIGPDTAPQTFRFARNVWYCEDRPERSQPTLPTKEADGVVGKDPLLRDPVKGDFALRRGSPAEGKGASALPPGKPKAGA